MGAYGNTPEATESLMTVTATPYEDWLVSGDESDEDGDGDVTRRDFEVFLWLTSEDAFDENEDGEATDPSRQGLARELARMNLSLNFYTQWYWKINLHNLLHFLSLRVDPHAQWEIQVFAEIIAGMVKRVAPLSYEAWVDYDLVGQPMSRAELEVLSRLLVGGEQQISARDGASLDADQLKEAGLSPREVRELIAKLQAPARPDFELDLSKMKSAEGVGKTMSEAVPGSFE